MGAATEPCAMIERVMGRRCWVAGDTCCGPSCLPGLLRGAPGLLSRASVPPPTPPAQTLSPGPAPFPENVAQLDAHFLPGCVCRGWRGPGAESPATPKALQLPRLLTTPQNGPVEDHSVYRKRNGAIEVSKSLFAYSFPAVLFSH